MSKTVEQFLRTFGGLLKESHQMNIYNQTNDSTSVNLGRYLRMSRLNSQLSTVTLSQLTGVEESEIIALEKGLIAPKRIKLKTLIAITSILNEEVALIEIIIDRKIDPISPVEIFRQIKQYLKTLAKKGFPSLKQHVVQPFIRINQSSFTYELQLQKSNNNFIIFKDKVV